jgi:hypothetical protein
VIRVSARAGDNVWLGLPATQLAGKRLDLTSVLSHHFCQVLTTMLKELKQVPKEPKVDTFQKYTQCFAV